MQTLTPQNLREGKQRSINPDLWSEDSPRERAGLLLLLRSDSSPAEREGRAASAGTFLLEKEGRDSHWWTVSHGSAALPLRRRLRRGIPMRLHVCWAAGLLPKEREDVAACFLYSELWSCPGRSLQQLSERHGQHREKAVSGSAGFLQLHLPPAGDRQLSFSWLLRDRRCAEGLATRLWRLRAEAASAGEHHGKQYPVANEGRKRNHSYLVNSGSSLRSAQFSRPKKKKRENPKQKQPPPTKQNKAPKKLISRGERRWLMSLNELSFLLLCPRV